MYLYDKFFNGLVRLVLIAGLLCSSQQLFGQQESQTEPQKKDQTWTLNFNDTDIQEVIRFVSKTIDKTIIIDPKVKGKVQVISSKPVNSQELYELFLSILEIQGFAAINSGDVIRIIPAKDARTAPVPVTRRSVEPSSEVITQVIQLENISAAKLIPVLRPLAPQQAHMAAYAPSNAIIISDTAANIARITDVIKSIDLSAVQKTDIIALEHASADEVVRMLDQLQKTQAQKGQAENKKVLLVADKRTNSILITGDELERQRLQSLINYLDTPLAQHGNVKVLYLEYAQATELAGVLTKVVQSMEGAAQQAGGQAAQRPAATIEADEGTNSLIITANADIMQSLLSVVERLDIRRAQVLVEAIIVELSDDNDDIIGIDWLFVNNNGAYGSVTNSTAGPSVLGAIAGVENTFDALENAAAIGSAISGRPGGVLGVGRLDDDISFNVVLNALQTNTQANILSTPSLMTLDNEEASITVGRSIPFVTGSFTSTGNNSNPDNPFQTVDRENVGITLRVTPQINEGDSLVLAISQEISDVLPTEGLLNDNPITSERSIETNILADNGQVIVIGGLIEDRVTQSSQKIPLLGDIPWLGRLFRSDGTNVTKTHLLVFLRPTIVRDSKDMDIALSLIHI